LLVPECVRLGQRHVIFLHLFALKSARKTHLAFYWVLIRLLPEAFIENEKRSPVRSKVAGNWAGVMIFEVHWLAGANRCTARIMMSAELE
jgi:hypothetical protein